MEDRNVLVIGGGVAGLSAALELANFNIHVEIVEKSDFLGGHAIGFACKATRNKCVRCGACMAQEKLSDTVYHKNIKVVTGASIKKISGNKPFKAIIRRKSQYIDPKKCTECGICFQRCPSQDGIISGFSKDNIPFYALNEENCLHIKDKSCSICRDECPEDAISFDQTESEHVSEADAVLVATGFKPFNPSSKPYGYSLFKNVVTTLDLERMLRRRGKVTRPSDNAAPNRIAFIQCVGSRDLKLTHLWCSKICCGSSLRTARLIKENRTETDITFFFIDIQSFGKDFEQFYNDIQEDVRMIRTIPGDIVENENRTLKVSFADSKTHQALEEDFDLVVLSIGITPCEDIRKMAGLFNLQLNDSGFMDVSREEASGFGNGVFTAGTVQGPMSIPETIADAGRAAWEIVKYLNGVKTSE